jgi:hypothetical protein
MQNYEDIERLPIWGKALANAVFAAIGFRGCAEPVPNLCQSSAVTSPLLHHCFTTASPQFC